MDKDEDLKPLHGLPGYQQILAHRDEIQRTRAEKIRDTLRQQFGRDYLVEVDPPTNSSLPATSIRKLSTR